MVSLPFNSIEKENFRIPPGSLKYKYRAQAIEGKTIQEISEEVMKRNEMRRLVKDLKEVEKDTMSNFRASSLPPKNNDFKPKAREEKSNEIMGRLNLNNFIAYGKREPVKRSKTNVSGGETSKLTMKKIGEMKADQLKKVDAKFDPADLIDENDDEDDIYLAEYSIDADKKPVPRSEEKDAKFENYGKLKRGMAVNGRYGRGPPSPVKQHGNYDMSPHSASYIDHKSPPMGFASYLESPRHQGASKLIVPASMKNTKNINYLKQSLDYDYSPSSKKSNLLGMGGMSPGGQQVSSVGYQQQAPDDYYHAHKNYYNSYNNNNYASQPHP